MKKLFIVGTVVVLICSMWVSFNHTLELFRHGRFTNGLEWPATIAAETAFIMGLLKILDSRKKGYSPPGQAVMLFLIGLFVVGWSNVGAAMGYELFGNWTGVILGVLIPTFVFGAESVLSHAYIESAKHEEDSHSHNTDDSHTASHSHTVKEPHTVRESHTVSHAATRSHTVTRSHTDTRSHTGEDSHNVSESHTNSHTNSHDNEQEPSHNDSHTATHKNSRDNTHDNSHGDSHGSHGDSHGNSHTTSRSHNADDSHTATRSHGETNTVRDSHTVTQSHDDSRTPIEWAIHIYEETGSLPSIRKLAEVADCSEWQARKALSQLKKQKKIS